MTHVIGVAGHVDHGKSSVIKALTGKVTARYREEIEREITIDIGFARLEIEGCGEVSIIDVPGHEDFVHNMIAGIGGIKLALMVIAANEGIMPQTVEHFEILRFAGIKRIIFILNKCDLAAEFDIKYREAEIEEFIKGTIYDGAPVIAFSAEKKIGIERLIDCLKTELLGIAKIEDGFAVSEDKRLVLYPVDRFFEKQGAGYIATGTLQSGIIKCNNEYIFMPGGAACKIRSVEVNGKRAAAVLPGTRVAVNAIKEKTSEISRGCFLTTKEYNFLFRVITVKLDVCSFLNKDVKSGLSVKFYFYTACYKAKLRLLETGPIKSKETAYCQIIFEKPEFIVPFANFIIRAHTDEYTLGGGIILECGNEVVKNKKKIVSRLSEISSAGAFDLPGFKSKLLIKLFEENYFMTGPAACFFMGVTYDHLLEVMNQAISNEKISLMFLTSDFVTAPVFMVRAEKNIKDETAAFFKINESLQEVDREALLDLFEKRPNDKRKFFDILIDKMIKSKEFIKSEKGLLPAFLIKNLKPAEVLADKTSEEIRQKILKSFETGNLMEPKTLEDVKLSLPKNYSNAFNSAVKFAETRKQIYKIFDNYYISDVQYTAYVKILKALSELKTGFSVIDFKEKTGLSRKYAIGLLEFFDKIGITIRKGNEREVSDNFRLTLTLK